MHLSPDDDQAIRAEFTSLTTLSQAELRAWLETAESHKVGMVSPGETESVGRQSARRILRIRDKAAGGPAPWGDVTRTRYRWSLMNWGTTP